MDRGSGSEYLRDYLDFDLEIREGSARNYSVVVRSPAGEAQEEMRFPFDERQLRDKLKDLEIALLRSGGTRRRLSSEEQTVQNFGRNLFEAVLVGKVGTCYYRSMDQAQQQGKGLRLKLHVQPPNLTVLPWEFLYDPDRDEYLCFSRDTPIVRYTDLRQPVSQLTVAPPLRILGMVASPRDLDPLDVEHEKGLMDEAIEDLQADGLVELTWLEGESWRDLQRAMRRGGPWHIFHFVGHGDFDLAAEEGLIAFTEKGIGRRHLLRSRDLARLLDGHPYLRLVFLNSCEGARGSEGDPFSGTAATLVRRGIPAVVAMQYQITDKAAIEFSSAFYESLADGLPVDAAVTEARVAVSMDSMLEWGTPVLYMRSRDGRLFDISTGKRPPEQPLEITDQEESLRQYREDVGSIWADRQLNRSEIGWLDDHAKELGLSASDASTIEREVMGDAKEAILERQEHAAREKERRDRLDELYAQARQSHRSQEWQAVVDVFEQIHAEHPNYPDPEGLLQSAREALEIARKEQDTIRRYREAVESAWADENLNRREVKKLGDLVNRLKLSPNTAAQIEREVMGETIEAILNRQEQATTEQYRKAVEEAWTENELSNAEAKWLSSLVSELGLSTDTAADIEREVIGDTIPALLQRQRRLDELYTQARQLHQGQEWQMVVDVFEQIHSEDPGFPDPEGLLASARDALDRMRKVADLYDQALRYVDGSEWQQALECFEEVRRLEPGYRDTEELLSRVRRELAPPPAVKAPNLSGQEVSQASSTLISKGLKLGVQREVSSDTVPEGQIIGQSPEAGKEVQTGTSMSVTISSGPATVEIPDPAGRSRDEERSTEARQALWLSLGDQAFFDELTRVCAKYTGLGYYVNEAIPGQNLSEARSSIPIPTGERVIALVDNSSMLSRGIGLAVCGNGIRWRNYAENPVSKKIRGFLEWPEFADLPLREHHWATEYGIEMGRDNVFVAWKGNTMDQHRLVKLLLDIQSLVKSSISH